MLSVCIPVYNTDINPLINALIKEIDKYKLAVEIITIDDASSDKWEKINNNAFKKVRNIKLQTNIGRARIRNLFLQYAIYEYLLFIDNDSLIISEKFLSTYLNSIKQNTTAVICGGRIYNSKPASRKQLLRWKYGIKKESRSLNDRIQEPYKSFMTNNFMIHRRILEKIPFDEHLDGYGHEDTLFGYCLKKDQIPVRHIDNPIMNGEIENNEEYLKKTEEAICSLIKILNIVNNDPEFINDIKLLSAYTKLSSAGMVNFTYFLFILSKPFIRFMLIKGLISIRLFNFFKLGIFINKYHTKPKQ